MDKSIPEWNNPLLYGKSPAVKQVMLQLVQELVIH